MADPRICAECGSDRWRSRDYQRQVNAARANKDRAERLARENGLLRAQLAWQDEDRKHQHSYLSQKVVRQARAIRRFEERLKDQKPWRDHSLEENAPGTDYDAATPLPSDREDRP